MKALWVGSLKRGVGKRERHDHSHQQLYSLSGMHVKSISPVYVTNHCWLSFPLWGSTFTDESFHFRFFFHTGAISFSNWYFLVQLSSFTCILHIYKCRPLFLASPNSCYTQLFLQINCTVSSFTLTSITHPARHSCIISSPYSGNRYIKGEAKKI